MPFATDYIFPSDEELTTKEIKVTSPTLRAVGQPMGIFCGEVSREFILCRSEFNDPRKCLAEGREVTACGLKFLQQMKKLCRDEVVKHADCLEMRSGDMHPRWCRDTEAELDKCVFDNFGIERPHLGYFSMPQVHKTDRPKHTDPVAEVRYQKPPSLDDAPPEIRDAPPRHGYSFRD